MSEFKVFSRIVKNCQKSHIFISHLTEDHVTSPLFWHISQMANTLSSWYHYSVSFIYGRFSKMDNILDAFCPMYTELIAIIAFRNSADKWINSKLFW